jgi:predicted N-acyltransferase
MSNRQESNVTCIKTNKYPNGTNTREETMDALESHYKDTFTEKPDRPRLGDEWFNRIKTVSDRTK